MLDVDVSEDAAVCSHTSRIILVLVFIALFPEAASDSLTVTLPLPGRDIQYKCVFVCVCVIIPYCCTTFNKLLIGTTTRARGPSEVMTFICLSGSVYFALIICTFTLCYSENTQVMSLYRASSSVLTTSPPAG